MWWLSCGRTPEINQTVIWYSVNIEKKKKIEKLKKDREIESIGRVDRKNTYSQREKNWEKLSTFVQAAVVVEVASRCRARTGIGGARWKRRKRALLAFDKLPVRFISSGTNDTNNCGGGSGSGGGFRLAAVALYSFEPPYPYPSTNAYTTAPPYSSPPTKTFSNTRCISPVHGKNTSTPSVCRSFHSITLFFSYTDRAIITLYEYTAP